MVAPTVQKFKTVARYLLSSYPEFQQPLLVPRSAPNGLAKPTYDNNIFAPCFQVLIQIHQSSISGLGSWEGSPVDSGPWTAEGSYSAGRSPFDDPVYMNN